MMKPRLLASIASLLGLSIVVASSCSPMKPLGTPTTTAGPPGTPFPLASFTATLVPVVSTLTAVPPLAPENEEGLAAVLQSKECTPPCFLGITPGSTSLGEATNLLKAIGGIYTGELEGPQGRTEYAFRLDVGSFSEGNQGAGPNVPLVFANVALIPDDSGNVQVIDLVAATRRSTGSPALFRRFWSRYNAAGMLDDLGPPARIYAASSNTTAGSSLVMDYRNEGAFIRLTGDGEETNICAEEQAPELVLRMILYDPSASPTIESLNLTNVDASQWTPVDAALGVNESSFIDAVTADPSVCFMRPG